MVYMVYFKWSTEKFSVDYIKINELHVVHMQSQKFSVDYIKINELHVVHIQSHAIWVDEITRVIISIKKVDKNLNILEK